MEVTATFDFVSQYSEFLSKIGGYIFTAFPGGNTKMGVPGSYPVQYFYGNTSISYYKTTFREYFGIPMDKDRDNIHIKLFGQIKCPFMKPPNFIGPRSGTFRKCH